MAAGETLASRREERRRKKGRGEKRGEKEREREREDFYVRFGGKVKVDTHEFGGLRRQHVRVLY